jgi:penicillin V acylase-like amidase (Ntn superfamily)
MKSFSPLFIILLASLTAFPCTTFFIKHKGEMVFGRNYDWMTDAGMVNTNQRGLAKTSIPTADGSTIQWTSKYGSITFNQYGKEIPTGGMNEKGLVVELMWLDETRYPLPDQRPSIGVLQWIQYQLDNSSTIDEVIATDKILRIAAAGTTPLHYLIADATGKAASIEFLDGKMIVHRDEELKLPVLTNSVYSNSVDTYEKAVANGNTSSFANNSLSRFSTACSMIRELSMGKEIKSLTDYAFEILKEVGQGNYTKWSIVYDVKNRKIFFRTNRFSNVKNVSFSAFDFSCKSKSKSWDMNQDGKNEVSTAFKNYEAENNRKLVETAFRESSSTLSVDPKTIEKVWQYPATIQCQ